MLLRSVSLSMPNNVAAPSEEDRYILTCLGTAPVPSTKKHLLFPFDISVASSKLNDFPTTTDLSAVQP